MTDDMLYCKMPLYLPSPLVQKNLYLPLRDLLPQTTDCVLVLGFSKPHLVGTTDYYWWSWWSWWSIIILVINDDHDDHAWPDCEQLVVMIICQLGSGRQTSRNYSTIANPPPPSHNHRHHHCCCHQDHHRPHRRRCHHYHDHSLEHQYHLIVFTFISSSWRQLIISCFCLIISVFSET